MVRIRTPFVSGTILNNPLLIGDTSLSSAALSSLATVTSPDIAVLVLDPAGSAGVPEVVWVTAHTAAATTATIARAQEGSTARQHLVGVPWVHGATTYDIRGTMPEYLRNDSHAGQTIANLPIDSFTANTAILGPICPLTEDVLLTDIWFYVGTQSGTMDVGVYSTTDGATFTRVGSKGSFSTPAAGPQNAGLSSSITLYRGTRYYWGMSSSTTAAVFGCIQNVAPGVASYMAVTKAASHPLPSSITAVTTSVIRMPEMLGALSGGLHLI